MSRSRANRSGVVEKMGTSSHQRTAHAFLTQAGYEYVRGDSMAHNHYENARGQHIVVTGSPQNSSSAIQKIKAEIRKNREKGVDVGVATEPDVKTKMVAMADPFLLKPVDPSVRHQVRARASAFDAWLKRVLEKHGPVSALELDEAAAQIGFTHGQVTVGRSRIGAAAYRDGVPWMVCLDYQVPEDKQARRPSSEIGVVAEALEIRAPLVLAPMNGNGITPLPKPQLSEQQQALMLMAETLGIQMPGESAREALRQAEDRLDEALEAVRNALAVLG